MTSLITSNRIFERAFVDGDRSDLFSQLGQVRSPFQGARQWPLLADEFARHSRDLFERLGHDGWQERGGERQEYGLTLRVDSEAADEVVRRLEHEHGGFIIEDMGTSVAIRLIRSRKRGRRFGIGLAINECDSESRTSVAPGVRIRSDGSTIRLAGRAAQLLWLIHAKVIRNRCSLITLPDSFVKEVLWDAARIPKDWRRDLEMTFKSLLNLRVEVFDLNGPGWQPRLGASSILLDHVAFSWNLGELASPCDPTCGMWGTAGRHHHIEIGIGHAFLGVLERCISGERDGVRAFDFGKMKDKDDLSRIEPATPLFQALIARKSLRLAADEQAVFRAIINELTLGPDRVARRLAGNVTPQIPAPCPCLAADQEYLAFNGNGRNPGYGYRLVGQTERGWIFKVGLKLDDNPRPAIRLFLSSLERLSSRFGFIAAGCSRLNNTWWSLSELLIFARSPAGYQRLDQVLLRVYAPGDFFVRLIQHFDSGELPSEISVRDSTSLNEQLRATGLSHEQLARRLNVRRPFVTNLLNGRRAWPESRIQKAEELLSTLRKEREAE